MKEENEKRSKENTKERMENQVKKKGKEITLK